MKKFLYVVLMCLVWAIPGHCHPHVFVDATVQVLFDQSGMTAVHNRWVYDELYSAAMTPSDELKKDILDPAASHNYYNYVLQGTEFLKANEVRNFKSSFQNNRLVLDFDVIFECPSKVNDYTMVVVVVADPSNYIQMTADMENSDVSAPDEMDVEYFDDGLEGLTLFRAFRPEVRGLFLRFKKN